MKKPETLRRHLEANLPDITAHPDRLRVRVESGAIATKPGASLSFEWRYKLILLFTDFVDAPDTIVVPLLAWLSVNQPDIIADAERRYKTLAFVAEVIDNKTIDIEFTLELTERVIVKAVAGGFECTHVDEPPLPDLDGPTGWVMFAGGEIIE